LTYSKNNASLRAEDVKDDPASPYLAEFRTRPAAERRAASIHAHVDGDKGPSVADVSSACLRCLFCLLERVNWAQLGYIMRSSFDHLDELKQWDYRDHCCWFALKTAEWSQYQYRYAVPTLLVERLLEEKHDLPATASTQKTIAAMVTTVFDSTIPLINLSTSDINSNLMTLLIRRCTLNCEDPLLHDLVESIASLGKHVYYSDQIQDLAVVSFIHYLPL
jgi:protein EFR3